MSGSSFKSDSAYKYCLVQSTPTLNQECSKLKSLSPSVLRVGYCVFGFEKSIDVFESLTSNKHSKLPSRIAILTSWFGLWNNAALCLPLGNFLTLHRSDPHKQTARCGKHLEFHSCCWPICQLWLRHISDDLLREVRCKWVSPSFLGSMLCWWRSVSTSMILVWQTHRHHDWDKHLDCWIHRLVCVWHWNNLMNTFLNLPNQSLHVSQSYATKLIPDSSITPASDRMRHRWRAPHRWDWSSLGPSHESKLAINTRSSSKYPSLTSSQSAPHSFKICWHSSGISGTKPAISSIVSIWSSSFNCPRSAFRIVSINFGLYMFDNVVCISRFIQFLSQIFGSCFQNSSAKLFWFSNCLSKHLLFSTSVHCILIAFSEHSICISAHSWMNFILRDSLHDVEWRHASCCRT